MNKVNFLFWQYSEITPGVIELTCWDNAGFFSQKSKEIQATALIMIAGFTLSIKVITLSGLLKSKSSIDSRDAGISSTPSISRFWKYMIPTFQRIQAIIFLLA